KVGEKVRRLPVGNPRQKTFDVSQHRFEGLSLLRRRRRKARANLPGRRAGEDRKGIDATVVVGDPVHGGVAPPTEFLGCHMVAGLLSHRALLEGTPKAYCAVGSCPRWCSVCQARMRTSSCAGSAPK